MSIWKFADDLPPIPPEHRLTMGEGDTPLVHSRRIGKSLGLNRLHFKLECCNPTGSFKDRFAVMAVSDMLAKGAKFCLATSSGNTGSALSAACAVAGIRCFIAVVDGAPLNKIRNMQAYGATVYSVQRFGIDPVLSRQVMDELIRLCRSRQAMLQISSYVHSPLGMAGAESLGHELAVQTSGTLQHVFTPSGAGGMSRAVARGFLRQREKGNYATVPAVHCVQPEGNNTLAGPMRQGLSDGQEVNCTTKISGLQVPTVFGARETIHDCRSTGGTGFVVTDDEVYAAQRRLAREEGILSEPAGAVALAGLIRATREGLLGPDDEIACLVTGIGFKDEASLAAMVAGSTCPVLPSADAIDGFLDRGA